MNARFLDFLRIPGWKLLKAEGRGESIRGLRGTCVWLALAGTAGATDVSHLGFTYDPKIHVAAEAAAAAKAAAEPGEGTASADGVLHLPKYVVAKKRQELVGRELLSDKGRLELAKQRYISPVYAKTLGPLAALAGFLANPLGGIVANNAEAMALYEDDERKRRNLEAADLDSLVKLSDQLKSIVPIDAPAKP